MKNMNLKRLITAMIGLPVVILLIILGNEYMIDAIIAIIAVVAMYEYAMCIKSEAKFISWIGYLSAISIAFIHVVPSDVLNTVITLGVPILLFLLFLTVIITDMKITFKDATFSFMGIMYVVGFLGFLPILYGVKGGISGKFLIWFVLIAAWGTDAPAYIVGKNFGKHKFSKVSANKTIEGCIGGIIGSVLIALICVFVMNTYFNTEIAYLTISILTTILSVIGQVGDFSASVIKRYFSIKDFSELFPGHGGMLDRIDSVMFISPFAYFLLTMFL